MRVTFAIAIVMMTPGRARAACTDVEDKPVTIATAATADEYALTVDVESASPTRWDEANNEALVLEVSGAHRGLIGHLIVHQGHTRFDYAMHVGALAAGEAVQVKISPLSASKATHRASACAATLVAVSTLGEAGEGVKNAPEFRWPIQKAFDDVPLVVGWSKSHKSYTTVMTNENGGTAEICGGGATGMQTELARWGRSTDIEDHWHYGKPHFERCTGSGETPVRMEAAHPILYEGSGHNRLFESRGGYGQVCGSGKADKPDGDLDGWNVHNPGNSLADDVGRVIILRPLPVDLDALGYAEFTGRREALSDHYAPWIYRLSSLELQREHKIDNAKTFAMDRYLYLDVRIANVGGEGDSYCTKLVHGGFKIRVTTKKGVTFASPQMTKKYAGGQHNWKRIAIVMPAGVTAGDIEHLAFDAFDKDGMYLTAVGDAFVAKPEGDNGAKLDYVRKGTTARSDYVDDDRSGCKSGVNHAGPGGTAYTCVGSRVDFK
jgi:hypothetical protein